MSAAAGIGATSISTIEGTLRSSRFYDRKYCHEMKHNLRLQALINVLVVDTKKSVLSGHIVQHHENDEVF